MADRPASFAPPMALALHLDRKTQTRRLLRKLLKFGPISDFGRSTASCFDWQFRDRAGRLYDLTHARLLKHLPYQVGDRLYVRESIRGEISTTAYYGIGWVADSRGWTPARAAVCMRPRPMCRRSRNGRA